MPERLSVPVRVIPGSRTDGVDGERAGRLVLRLSAPPEGGAANRAAQALLASAPGVRAGEVRPERGITSRDKILERPACANAGLARPMNGIAAGGTAAQSRDRTQGAAAVEMGAHARAYESGMAASVALRIDLPMTGLASPVTFADGVREHQAEVFGVALRITGDREAALDVTSSTFLKAYRAFDRYDQRRPLRHWLLRIATNEAISYVRKRGRELRRRVDVEKASALPDPTAAPDAESVAREDRARIRVAVSLLPTLYRVVIVLRYFNELSVEEIAQVTGRPPSTVGVQLLRGRALLRSALQGGQ